ncbi:MAG: hypothetical protein K2N63_05855 [Lachnospiraceae bacterium]|nr:hypothetical protein [Lachnospiraceae bacterium]
MAHFDEDDNRLAKILFLLSAILLISFTILDILNKFTIISNSLKLSGTVLCFLYTVLLLFLYSVDMDRTSLMLSMLFAVAADVFLLFTRQYLVGVILFCFVQEFHSIRLLNIHRSIVRMNGRISSSYRSYKVWKAILLQNLIQLLLAAVLPVATFFVEIGNAWLGAAAIFYISGFLANIIRVFAISRDVRLLDDMKPLRCYAFGMLSYFLCDLFLALVRLPAYIPFLHVLSDYTKYMKPLIWPFYLIGLALIAISGARHQNFYS